jgi:hypothetical protein
MCCNCPKQWVAFGFLEGLAAAIETVRDPAQKEPLALPRYNCHGDGLAQNRHSTPSMRMSTRILLALLSIVALAANNVACASASRGPLGMADLEKVAQRIAGSTGAAPKQRNRAGLLVPSAPTSLPTSPPSEKAEKPRLRRAISLVEELDHMFEDNGKIDRHGTRFISKNKAMMGVDKARKPDSYYRAYDSLETMRLKTRLYPDMEF